MWVSRIFPANQQASRLAAFFILEIQQNIRAISKASAQQSLNKFILVYLTPTSLLFDWVN